MSDFLVQAPPYFLRQGLSFQLELTALVWPDGLSHEAQGDLCLGLVPSAGL